MRFREAAEVSVSKDLFNVLLLLAFAGRLSSKVGLCIPEYTFDVPYERALERWKHPCARTVEASLGEQCLESLPSFVF